MKRVIILPLSDFSRLHGWEVVCRERTLGALVSDTAPGRARAAYDSEEAFLEAVRLGLAHRYTFPDLEE